MQKLIKMVKDSDGFIHILVEDGSAFKIRVISPDENSFSERVVPSREAGLIHLKIVEGLTKDIVDEPKPKSNVIDFPKNNKPDVIISGNHFAGSEIQKLIDLAVSHCAEPIGYELPGTEQIIKTNLKKEDTEIRKALFLKLSDLRARLSYAVDDIDAIGRLIEKL